VRAGTFVVRESETAWYGAIPVAQFHAAYSHRAPPNGSTVAKNAPGATRGPTWGPNWPPKKCETPRAPNGHDYVIMAVWRLGRLALFVGPLWDKLVPGGPISAPKIPTLTPLGPQWRELSPLSCGPESLRSVGIRAQNVQKLTSSHPHSDRAMKACARAHLSCGSAKLHGTERFRWLKISAQDPNIDPSRATMARIVATQVWPRILP
jgi:hypothetical protein